MSEPKDEDVETRAMELARADQLEWVNRPNRAGQPDTPASATNTERDSYRDDARDQLKEETAGDQ